MNRGARFTGNRITREGDDRAMVIVVAGELDISTSPRFGVAINEVLRARPECLLIDLRNVEFLDSTGLAVLLNARRRTIRHGINLVLVCDVPSTLRQLELTRLRSDFAICPSREEAFAALGVVPRAREASPGG